MVVLMLMRLPGFLDISAYLHSPLELHVWLPWHWAAVVHLV